MKLFTYQGNEKDCGFASLKMLLANISHNKSYLNISKPSKKESYNLRELEELASEYGVILESSTCDNDYLDKAECPCLTLINNSHVVLLKKVKKHHVIIYDPGIGIRRINKEQFLMIWNKVVMEVIDACNIVQIGKIEKQILPKKMHVLQVIISFISTLSLITAFYFLNNVENFMFSIIFLVVFCFAQAIENFSIYKQINYFDERFIPLYFKDDSKKNKVSYEEFLNFKRKYFVSNRGILSSVLMAFLITFLLCMNDFRNILALIILILFKLFDIIVFSKPNQAAFNVVGNLEAEALENKDKLISNLSTANKFSNEKVFKDSIKNLLFMVLCFALSIIMMVFTRSSGCNFVIFHFVIYFVGFKSYSEILDYLSLRKEQQKSECQFLDNCNL